MAEALSLSREEFEKRLVDVDLRPDPSAAPISPVPVQGNMAETIRQRIQRPNVPLDMATGAPFLTRLNASRAPDDETRLNMLRDSFSGSTVDQVEPFYQGGPSQFVVRDYKDPETGQLKDLLVDETAISAKDLADLGSLGVELIGALAAMRGGRGISQRTGTGFGRLLTEAALANTGAAVAGAASDLQAVVGTTAQGLRDVPLANIAAQRALNAGVGLTGDVAFGAPVILGTKVANLWRGVPITAEARAAVAARDRLAKQTGQSVEFTLGQQTGRPGIQQSESFLENVTVGGGPLRRFRGAQEQQLRDVETAIVGPGPLPDKDTLGAQAVRALRSVATGMEDATTQARTDALMGAVDLLEQAIDSATGLGTREVLAREAGTAVQLAEQAKKDSFDDISAQLKAVVTEKAGTDAFIPSAIARKHIAPIVKSLSRPESGEMFEAIPARVRAFLSDIQALPRTKKSTMGFAEDIGEEIVIEPGSKGLVTLEELRRIRTELNGAINESQILGTAETANLKQISKALTATLEEGIEYAPNPDAKAALEAFNKFYRENTTGFQVKGVTELLADPTQRKIDPFGIFNQASGNAGQYFRIKDALVNQPLVQDGNPVGPVAAGQATWRVFKQAMLHEMLDSTRISGSGRLVDGKKFLGKLNGLDTEVKRDLLGTGADTASTALARLEHLQNPKLDAEEVLEILRRGGQTAGNEIFELAQREQQLADLYRNQMIRRFVKGEVGSEAIQPGQFIDRYVDIAPAPELREVMLRLDATDPDLADTIRRKTVSNLFITARKDPITDVASAKKLAKEIGTEEMQNRLRAVLGPQTLENVNDFLAMLGGIQTKADATSKAAGGMSGGGAKNDLLLLQIAKWPKQAWRWGIGFILTNRRLHRLALGPIQPLDPTAVLKTIIVGDDFVKGAVQEFGREAATVLSQIEQATAEVKPPPKLSREDFEKQLR